MCDSTNDTYTLLIIYYLHHHIKKGKIHRLYCLSSEHWVPFLLDCYNIVSNKDWVSFVFVFFTIANNKKMKGSKWRSEKKCFERKNSVTDYYYYSIYYLRWVFKLLLFKIVYFWFNVKNICFHLKIDNIDEFTFKAIKILALHFNRVFSCFVFCRDCR